MAKLLALRAQLITMLIISILLMIFVSGSMLLPSILIAVALSGVQLEINRD